MADRFAEDVFDHEVVDVAEAKVFPPAGEHFTESSTEATAPNGPSCPYCVGVIESTDETQGNIGICTHCKTAVDLDALLEEPSVDQDPDPTL